MTRMLNLHTTVFRLILILPMLVGCASQNFSIDKSDSAVFTESIDLEHDADEKLLEALDNLRDNPEALDMSENMYRRKMSLTYSGTVNHLTEHHRKVITLFFQTLPENKNISIILSAAPSSSSSSSGFEGVKDAWVRVQELKNYLKKYSEEIEELYIPDQPTDTVTIQVLGGGQCLTIFYATCSD